MPKIISRLRDWVAPTEAIGWPTVSNLPKGSYQDWSYGIKLDNASNATESALLAAQQLKIDFPTGAESECMVAMVAQL